MDNSQIRLQEFIQASRERQEAGRKAVMGDTDSPPELHFCECGLTLTPHPTRGHLWCGVCEISQTDLQDQAARKLQRHRDDLQARKAASEIAAIAQNDTHPIYGFMRRLTAHILDQYDLTYKVIFRNLQASDHSVRKDGSHLIRYGYQAIDRTEIHGFLEYATWTWVWPDYQNLVGKRGVWAIVLHEAAHALQSERNGRHYRSQHNRVWSDAVRELQILFPFEEVQNL